MEFKKHFFADWDDADWCKFDNYMVYCLQGYLNTGLVESTFVNLGVRQLSAATSHEFIEWCGLLKGAKPNPFLEVGCKTYKKEMFQDFIEDNLDYSPKGRMPISRTLFYKWLFRYCIFKYGIEPEDDRDSHGRWIRVRNKHDVEFQSSLSL